MILNELTIDGTLHRISTIDAALEHQWYNWLVSARSLKLALPKPYGGYLKPSFSHLVYSPEPFADYWPPPKSCACVFKTTYSDEASAVTLFSGIAHRGVFDRTKVEYQLSQPDYDATVAKSTAFSDTLVNVFTTLCGASYLNLSVDTSGARSPSPAVNYTLSGDKQAIDLLSDLCAFFSHACYRLGDTMYLVDLLAAGSAETFTEWDILPSSYGGEKPVALVTCGDYRADGSDPHGDEVSVATAYHGAGANIEAALADIVTLLEKELATFSMMLGPDNPAALDVLTLTDESLAGSLTATVRLHEMIYNFDTEKLQAVGRGVLA